MCQVQREQSLRNTLDARVHNTCICRSVRSLGRVDAKTLILTYLVTGVNITGNAARNIRSHLYTGREVLHLLAQLRELTPSEERFQSGRTPNSQLCQRHSVPVVQPIHSTQPFQIVACTLMWEGGREMEGKEDFKQINKVMAPATGILLWQGDAFYRAWRCYRTQMCRCSRCTVSERKRERLRLGQKSTLAKNNL